MKPSIYGQTHRLLRDLVDVECWNCSGESKATLKAGEMLTVQRVYDATHTTVFLRADPPEPGLSGHIRTVPTWNEGHIVDGYRFIVPNTVLAGALGIEMPEKTKDLVGGIIAYESGQMSRREEDVFLTENAEVLCGLSGHYERALAQL